MVQDGLPSSQPEFLLPPFTQVMNLLFCGHVQECGLSIIELSYLVKPSHFNMSISVKTIECLSNKMFDYAEFLMTNYFQKNLWPLVRIFLFLNFQMHIME